MMIEDYDGADLVDAGNGRIGKVERSYVDDTGRVRFVEVKMGGLRAKHRLVPTDQVERSGDALKVPFEKEIVEKSPDASSAGDTLEGDTLDEVRAYYARGGDQGTANSEIAEETGAVPADDARARVASASESDHEDGIGEKAKRAVERIREKLPGGGSDAGGDHVEASAGSIGQVRDLGDVIEIPIVEEELVKRPVVREVLRIRKSSLTEGRTVTAEVRKEEVEVDRQGDTSA
ncbi:MAG: DUF2382 domain-containing protein [Chloroflexi bacterium]|nr:DUF2382 domain-containing protein [Chloroflexota bacterium]